mmetsp:Transcript_11867/g.39077  ORF Transcript_11867/g.39077 Transcript_11867/m.39077 type:complete len:356 (+) Transcript_11867:56-1123(+)
MIGSHDSHRGRREPEAESSYYHRDSRGADHRRRYRSRSRSRTRRDRDREETTTTKRVPSSSTLTTREREARPSERRHQAASVRSSSHRSYHSQRRDEKYPRETRGGGREAAYALASSSRGDRVAGPDRVPGPDRAVADRRYDRGEPPPLRQERPLSPRRRRESSPAQQPPAPQQRKRSRSLSWSPPPAVRRQMAEAKARREREEREGTVKTGKFWDGFRWVEHSKASQTPSNPATRKERRLYVGNLPPAFDSEQLRIFLNEALRACGAIPEGVPEVVVSSWVSPDKKFAFVELSTVEAATTALGLSGITCMGAQLKICHPNNYVAGSAQALALQAAFGISTVGVTNVPSGNVGPI